MKKPLIVPPSVVRDEMNTEFSARDARITDKNAVTERDTQITDQKAQLVDQKAKNQHLQELIGRLSPCNPTP